MNTKLDFHKLIDKIDDEKALKSYFSLIAQLNKNQTGKIWQTLSSEEKEELLLSYDESYIISNLINHEDVKKTHDQWLKK